MVIYEVFHFVEIKRWGEGKEKKRIIVKGPGKVHPWFKDI